MKPKIRFKGFDGEWEESPFSKIVERISTSAQAGKLPGIEFEDIVSGEGRLNKDIYQKVCCKYGNLFREGDILFGKLRPYLKNILLADFKGVAIGDFWILRSKENDSKYLYTLVNSNSFMKIANISSGSKMPRADWNLVSSTKFAIPSSMDEQRTIGEYFTSLDAQISASASRLASLKQIKAASLQAMFPKEGETMPKVRFKGFKGEWKKVKLGNIFCERNESNINGEMLSVTQRNGIIKASENGRFDNSNSDKSNYKVVKVGDIAYNSMRMWQGASGYSPYEGIVSPAYTVIIPQEGIYSPFFAYLFKNENIINTFRLHSQGLTSDTWNLKFPAFSKIEILFPEDAEMKEQQKIAVYFTSLDRQITLHSQRLEKLKQIKAACLDKMFV